MKKIRKIKIKSFKSITGKLIPITFNKNFPFRIKRIFILYGLKKKNKRRSRSQKMFSNIYANIWKNDSFYKNTILKKKILIR